MPNAFNGKFEYNYLVSKEVQEDINRLRWIRLIEKIYKPLQNFALTFKKKSRIRRNTSNNYISISHILIYINIYFFSLSLSFYLSFSLSLSLYLSLSHTLLFSLIWNFTSTSCIFASVASKILSWNIPFHHVFPYILYASSIKATYDPYNTAFLLHT